MARLPANSRNLKPTSIRLSAEAQHKIALLQDKLGIKQSAIIELAIRRLAELEKVQQVALPTK